MARCVYPSCPVEIASGGETPSQWCESHEQQECVYPLCHEHVMPASGWCQEHNDAVVFFVFVHGLRHRRLMPSQGEATRALETQVREGYNPDHFALSLETS